MPIENWNTELAQLMFNFRLESGFRSRGTADDTFTDQFGNSIRFSHTNYSCFAPSLLKLLKNPKMKMVEIDDVDKGFLSYSVYQHSDGYFMLFETRVDLYGNCGHFTSFIVVPTLEFVSKFIDGLKRFDECYDEEEEEEVEE